MLEFVDAALIEPTLLAVYLVAAGAMILSPGPDTLYVLTRSVGDGRDAGIASAAGISVGVLVHTLAAVVGLSAVFRASEHAFATVTIVGAGYLVYLGVRTIRDDGLLVEDDNPSTASPFREAVLVNVLNPQVALFFLAFLPQFVDRAGHVPSQLSILGAIYAIVTMGYLVTVAVGSSAVRQLLFTRPRVAAGVRWLSGLILIGLGLRLLVGSVFG
ncbi:LysE family translocator [Natronorubrum texcoconense]|uniref:Threonine/homoserine/homoserine lactone efflux protein n=1 Tax=Natronorubrum texcoconense TaxID=1095776 RepID=A0A1G9E6D5_9EURY|nr:LysE family translocator [Natronorubrum texcoconense]SDK71617.1 Threonine/homoserine/homoserine lactone efflux protein [Natronorubrum texcoconense]